MSDVSYQSIQSYEQAAYFVLKKNEFDLLPNNIDFLVQCKQNNQCIDALLETLQLSSWALITAWNPESSKEIPKEENKIQNESLLCDIQNQQYTHIRYGFGASSNYDPQKSPSEQQDTIWAPEESFLILGISRESAILLGKKYRQNAILFGEKNGIVELVLCR